MTRPPRLTLLLAATPWRVAAIVTRYIVGGVLVLSSLLKLGTQPPEWFSFWNPWPTGFWSLAISFELVLGSLLLFGLASRFVWPILICFLAVLGAIAASLSFADQATCGCLGRIPLQPGYAALFDGVALLAMLATWPAVRAQLPVNRDATLVGKGVGVALVLLLLLFFTLATICRIKDGWNPVFAMRDQGGLTLVAESIYLGDVQSGQRRVFDVLVRNNASLPIKIVGAESPSYLSMWEALPIVVPPRDTRKLQGAFEVHGGKMGVLVVPFQFFTDADQQPSLYGRVSVRVVAVTSDGS